MDWHDVVRREELWDGEIVSAQVAGKRIFLFSASGVIHAYEDRCPHQMNPLSDGALDGKMLTCKTHRWRFDLESGCGINPSSSRLVSFPVRVQDGQIQVAIVPAS